MQAKRKSNANQMQTKRKPNANHFITAIRIEV
jgi:hypothetical protein